MSPLLAAFRGITCTYMSLKPSTVLPTLKWRITRAYVRPKHFTVFFWAIWRVTVTYLSGEDAAGISLYALLAPGAPLLHDALDALIMAEVACSSRAPSSGGRLRVRGIRGFELERVSVAFEQHVE